LFSLGETIIQGKTPVQASTIAHGTGFRALMVIVIVGLAISACGRPFVDSRRETGNTDRVGLSNPNRPVICYAKGESSPQDVLALAAEVCAETGRVPRFDREDRFKCRMMQPWRAFFTCVAPSNPRANTAPPSGNLWWSGPDDAKEPTRPTDGPAWRRPDLGADRWNGSLYPRGVLPTPPRL